jgi:hypothetical protein
MDFLKIMLRQVTTVVDLRMMADVMLCLILDHGSVPNTPMQPIVVVSFIG